MAIHDKSSPLAGQTVTIRDSSVHPQIKDFGGSEFHVEDWWDIVSGGKSWKQMIGNFACLFYKARLEQNGLPDDDNVLYGKIKGLGYLVHVDEIVN
jgi:hypothetical protein